jgi:TRAP-type uncharacterized transport system fused permease subunit
VAVTGLHFLLPIVVLLWCILIERLSPAFSAYWATLSMIFVVVTQHPLKAMFRAVPSLPIRRPNGGVDLKTSSLA